MKKIFSFLHKIDNQNTVHSVMTLLCDNRSTQESIDLKIALDNQFNELLAERKAKAIADLEKIEEYYGNETKKKVQ